MMLRHLASIGVVLMLVGLPVVADDGAPRSPGMTGACCDEAKGVCQDFILEEDCAAPGLRFTPNTACASVNPPCAIVLGACCDVFGFCLWSGLEADCLAAEGIWHEGQSCKDYTCPPPPTGACCLPSEDCYDPWTEADCQSLGGLWYQDQTCSGPPPIDCPTIPTGACCMEGYCYDDFTEADCNSSLGLWFEERTCDGPPPVECPPLGACCDRNESCTDLTEARCLADGGIWYAGEACWDEPPYECPIPTGACCHDGGCLDTDEATCESMAGSLAVGYTCTSYACPACPDGSLFSQRSYHAGDEARELADLPAFENYSSLAADIWEVRWWGFHVRRAMFEYEDCASPSLEFQISFHQDDGGLPGAAVKTYSVTAQRTSSEIGYLWGSMISGYWYGTLWEYRATLDEACTLRSGWIQIAGGEGPNDCVLKWCGSPEGDGLSYADGGYANTFDLSLCLGGATQGACCHASLPGHCAVMAAADCFAQGGAFLGNDSTCGSPDCNDNGLVDSCEVALVETPDCNGNGIPDSCDIAGGTSPDCNGNGIPDECEVPPLGAGTDCNHNLVPDVCDLAACQGEPWCGDCNRNGQLDVCDIADGLSPDCDHNGIPDECQPSFDADGDGDVDMFDVQAFVACMLGPVVEHPGGVCGEFDADNDGDVDLADLAGLQIAYTGSQRSAKLEPPTMSAPPAAPEVPVSETLQTEIEQHNSHNVYLFSGEFYLDQEDLRIKGRGVDFV